jgi:5-methyltetrahydrofolate--homocysteine methyltransferase
VDGTAVYRCPPEELASYVEPLAAAGVRLFGGCCGTGPEHIAALKDAVAKVDFSRFAPPARDPDVIPCASEKEARFITPDVDVGEPISCTPDLLEDILNAEEDCPQGALKIAILEPDDVDVFAENQYAIKDALCLSTDVPELLESALRAYQGRAFWDNTAELDPAFLREMSRKYGLILL